MVQLHTLGLKPAELSADIGEAAITVVTGAKGTRRTFSHAQVACVLDHFSDVATFPLGASATAPLPGGLGRFLQDTWRTSPRFASHLAAVLVYQGRLRQVARRQGQRGVWLAVPCP